MTQLKDLIQTLDRYNAMVFVTDREVAPINALKRIFPDAYNLLRIWHINKNVFANLKSSLPYLRDGKTLWETGTGYIIRWPSQILTMNGKKWRRSIGSLTFLTWIWHDCRTRRSLLRHEHVILLITNYLWLRESQSRNYKYLAKGTHSWYWNSSRQNNFASHAAEGSDQS